ncbi:MAG TPA: tRNA pseudouridine(55) synthase TruB [Candidatus Caccovivens faecavium]|nr:tRNA pseudouridine(55) synthase TruB [Candidatus Caccovivens faecavium]
MLESGIILINKPKGISSNKVVNIVKATLHAKKCGHLGTLDLEGEGLLPITVNSATKLFDYFLKKDKTYEANFVFGYETDTLDTSGTIVKAKEVNFTEAELEEAVKGMIGKYEQMPPIYSAKKVGGKVAYVEARKGQEVNLSPKEVEIISFKILGKVGENTYRFEISCSSGTYIRSIARDLAYHLGTYGSMQCILRTRCGKFYLKNAVTLEEFKKGNFKLISTDCVFNYEKLELSDDEFFRIENGQTLQKEVLDGKYKLYNSSTFLGIGECYRNSLKLTLRLF